MDNDPRFSPPDPLFHQDERLWLTTIKTSYWIIQRLAQFLELQNELNKDGSKRSLSQVVDYALRVAMANAKAAPNADFRDRGELFSDPFERTI